MNFDVAAVISTHVITDNHSMKFKYEHDLQILRFAFFLYKARQPKPLETSLKD